LARLGLQAKVLAHDAADVAAWWDGVPFDAILLDAPCSASGIVRRHPDIRWLRRDTDIAQLVAIQARLLDALWPVLKPGGCLLYATCSVFKAEGSEQIQAFLARNSLARLLPSPGHLLPGLPQQGPATPHNTLGDHDGFFYALLQKSAP
jgi:16S rRNA (cytosine967-C5)-methyltransferase